MAVNGKVLVEPSIEVEDIEIQMDSDDEPDAENIMRGWGHSIPLIKINDYVLNIGECLSLTVNVSMYNLPTFAMTVEDAHFKIRETLKKELDTCIIFVGYKDFYVKFNGLILNNTSYDDDPTLMLSGIFYHEPLYNRLQKCYRDMNVQDILKEICSDTKIGLFSFENADLTKTIDYVINPNQRYIDFISTLINRYTDNIFAFDTFGYLHIGNVEQIKNSDTDKYVVNSYNGEVQEENPIIFTFGKRRFTGEESETDDEYRKKINCESLTVKSNFSLTKVSTDTKYKLVSDKNEIEMNSNSEIGTGELFENTFYGFEKQKFPHRLERVNKEISGNEIEIKLRNLMFEIVPFTVVELEHWIEGGQDTEQEYHLDEEHSGKHFVTGYSFTYNKHENFETENNFISQKIYLI